MKNTSLKQMRKDYNMTLKQLSEKVGYGVGNLSSYENGKLQAQDATLLRILTKGFDLPEQKAKEKITEWRQAEFKIKYGTETLSLAQNTASYNQSTTEQLQKLLKTEGLKPEEIEKVLKEVELLKKNK